MIRPERILERFLRYVRIDTTAVEGANCYPSSRGQWELGALLVQELHDMGYRTAVQDKHAIVLATRVRIRAVPLAPSRSRRSAPVRSNVRAVPASKDRPSAGPPTIAGTADAQP